MSLRLSQCKEGSKVRIISVDTCCDGRKRLMDLGIYAGREVSIVMSAGCGPIIVGVGSSRVALGRCLTENITVEEI